MTRQEYEAAVARINAYFDPRLQTATIAAAQAQDVVDDTRRAWARALKRLDEYRDAVKEKAKIDPIVEAGPPPEAVDAVVVAFVEGVVANG
jgi:hypothetical protein